MFGRRSASRVALTVRFSSICRLLLPVSLLALPEASQARGGYEETPKAYLTVDVDSLELLWNADYGEGRGAGEIFLMTVISWGGHIEQGDPQKRVFGPVGGVKEFPPSTSVEDPPGSGMYRIVPSAATEGLGRAYNNRADCPVPPVIQVGAYVWEDDSNTDVRQYAELILAGIKLVVDEASQNGLTPTITDLLSQGLLELISFVTYSKDDSVGKFVGAIPISDPCQGEFYQETWVPLENLINDQLWASAIGVNGFTFLGNRGIANPAVIGRLKFNIYGGVLLPDYASSHTTPYFIPPPDEDRYWHVRKVDIGQPEECFLTGALDLASPMPSANPDVTYRMYLDTDHEIASGSPSGASRGAEYEIRLPLTSSSSGVAPLLLRYDSGTGEFEVVAGAVVSADPDLDNSTIFLSTDLASIGNPSGQVAAWGVSSSVHGEFVAPPDADVKSPVITVQAGSSGLPPSVNETVPSEGARDVAVTDSIVIEFSKHMERSTLDGSLSFEPHVSGERRWDGRRLTLVPDPALQPGTLYRARIATGATDCIGNPLSDPSGNPEPYEWWFTTEPLPLYSASATGQRKDRLAVGDLILARGTQFSPFSQADVYVIVHDSLRTESGWPLVDVTPGGPNEVTFDSNGEMTLAIVGSAVAEGEYNLVVDVDRDGTFTAGLDRIDQTSIGFAVLGTSVDGARDATCSAYGVTQTTQTQFGDATLGHAALANGSELNAACATIDGNVLRLFVAGNLESNFNKLEIFFDAVPGGQNRLRGDNSSIDFGGLNRMGDAGTGDGFRFDAGFEADYWLSVGGGDPGGGYRLYANYATLPTAGGGLGLYLGETGAYGDGLLEGGNNPVGIRVAIQNQNTEGVTAGCGPGALESQPYGVEFLIPLSALGSPAGCVRMTMFVNGSSHDFVSNQFLAPVPPGTCNLGEPRAVNLAAVTGDQFFQACDPTTDVGEGISPSAAFRLRAEPNPFLDRVRIRLESPLPRGVTASIFDVTGRRVRALRASGEEGTELVWDGRDDRGALVGAGLYFLRVAGGSKAQELRLIRLR